MSSGSLSINDAVQIHLSGKLDEAEAIYRRILTTEPENSEALHLLGVIAYQRHQYGLAEDLITRAIGINKRVAEYRNNLGNGNCPGCFAAYRRIDPPLPGSNSPEARFLRCLFLKLNPKYADARINIGNILRERGRFQEAVLAYQKALKLDPTRAEIHNNLGP